METVPASNGFFTTLISGFDADQRFVLVIIGMSLATAVLIAVGCTIAGVWQSIRKREAELELTRDLLDQGKTAEEIERIVRPGDPWSRSVEHWATGGKKP